MNPRDLPDFVPTHSDVPAVSAEEIREHFTAKYPTIDHHGRPVFLFTTDRQFGDAKHLVTVHGPNSPVTPEHIYQYVLITYCFSGTFSMSVDGSHVTLEQGDCLVADRHVPHGVDPTGPDDCAVNVVLSDRFLARRFRTDAERLGSSFGLELVENGATHVHYRVYRSSGDELSRFCVEHILCEKFDPRLGSADIIDDFAAALLTHLLRTNETDVSSTRELTQRSRLIGKIREYVADNYREGSLSKMAASMGYESTYLSATIKKSTGATFKSMVNEERMRRATLLLHDERLPVYAIADEVGISNLTQFYKRFREFAGCTPQEYRDRS